MRKYFHKSSLIVMFTILLIVLSTFLFNCQPFEENKGEFDPITSVITSPKENELWAVGSNHEIAWEIKELAETYDVFIVLYGYEKQTNQIVEVMTIAKNLDIEESRYSYRWDIPEVSVKGFWDKYSYFFIRVIHKADEEMYFDSGKFFISENPIVVTSPVGVDKRWAMSEEHTIKWNVDKSDISNITGVYLCYVRELGMEEGTGKNDENSNSTGKGKDGYSTLRTIAENIPVNNYNMEVDYKLPENTFFQLAKFFFIKVEGTRKDGSLFEAHSGQFLFINDIIQFTSSVEGIYETALYNIVNGQLECIYPQEEGNDFYNDDIIPEPVDDDLINDDIIPEPAKGGKAFNRKLVINCNYDNIMISGKFDIELWKGIRWESAPVDDDLINDDIIPEPAKGKDEIGNPVLGALGKPVFIQTIAENVALNTYSGTYNWYIPFDLECGDDYFIVIKSKDASVSKETKEYFSIAKTYTIPAFVAYLNSKPVDNPVAQPVEDDDDDLINDDIIPEPADPKRTKDGTPPTQLQNGYLNFTTDALNFILEDEDLATDGYWNNELQGYEIEQDMTGTGSEYEKIWKFVSTDESGKNARYKMVTEIKDDDETINRCLFTYSEINDPDNNINMVSITASVGYLDAIGINKVIKYAPMRYNLKIEERNGTKVLIVLDKEEEITADKPCEHFNDYNLDLGKVLSNRNNGRPIGLAGILVGVVIQETTNIFKDLVMVPLIDYWTFVNAFKPSFIGTEKRELINIFGEEFWCFYFYIEKDGERIYICKLQIVGAEVRYYPAITWCENSRFYGYFTDLLDGMWDSPNMHGYFYTLRITKENNTTIKVNIFHHYIDESVSPDYNDNGIWEETIYVNNTGNYFAFDTAGDAGDNRIDKAIGVFLSGFGYIPLMVIDLLKIRDDPDMVAILNAIQKGWGFTYVDENDNAYACLLGRWQPTAGCDGERLFEFGYYSINIFTGEKVWNGSGLGIMVNRDGTYSYGSVHKRSYTVAGREVFYFVIIPMPRQEFITAVNAYIQKRIEETCGKSDLYAVLGGSLWNIPPTAIQPPCF